MVLSRIGNENEHEKERQQSMCGRMIREEMERDERVLTVRSKIRQGMAGKSRVGHYKVRQGKVGWHGEWNEKKT